MNGQSDRERELFDKLVRAAIDKKDVRKMVQGMAQDRMHRKLLQKCA